MTIESIQYQDTAMTREAGPGSPPGPACQCLDLHPGRPAFGTAPAFHFLRRLVPRTAQSTPLRVSYVYIIHVMVLRPGKSNNRPSITGII